MLMAAYLWAGSWVNEAIVIINYIAEVNALIANNTATLHYEETEQLPLSVGVLFPGDTALFLIWQALLEYPNS
jgi:hypothetical protein